MNRFVIIDGLPYLYAGGKTYAVRWNEKGFTVGAAVKTKAAASAVTYNELSIKAKCANLDSIGKEQKPTEKGKKKPAKKE